MGMYTAIKVKAKIKSPFLEATKNVLKERDFSIFLPLLSSEDQTKLQSYINTDRHEHVFSCVGHSIFSSYEAIPGLVWDLEVEGPSRLEGDVLYVHGSLKNYDQVIQKFVGEILPLISEEIISAEAWYEEGDEPWSLV